MENHYFDSVIAEMKPLFDEQGFSLQEDGSYKNDKKSVKVEYDEKSLMYRLFMAEVTEEGVGEYTEVSSWLFDDTQNAKDAESVGMDFSETVRGKIGAKLTRKTDAQVDLPAFSKDGAFNVTAFTKKVLDVFPTLKDAYREHIAKYGNFLYLDFFGIYLVPELKKVYTENNKKAVKKTTEVFTNAYISGDKEAVNVVVAVLSAAATDEKVKANLFAALDGNDHLKKSVESFIPCVRKNSKLSKLLLK